MAVLLVAACGTVVEGGGASPSPLPSPPASSSSTKAAPSATLPAHLLGQDITVIPTTARVVALTFDAGGNADGLPAILAALDAADVRGSFLLTGDFVRTFPTQSRAIVAPGHLVGNHSDTHPHFPGLGVTEQRAEVTAAATAIRSVTGVPPQPLFRFPYGDRTSETIAVVNGLGYLSVRWTVDTLGWKGTSGGQTASTVLDRVLGALRPGEIVLMHVGSNPDDGSTLDADALPEVIAALRASGYSFVTLQTLLG